MEFEDVLTFASALPESMPPLVVDIDGTLTDDNRAVDPRVFPVLRAWPSEVIVATGKAMPYPVGLCEFLGIKPLVIAENGGIALNGYDGIFYEGDRETATAVIQAYRDEGYDLGWGAVDLVNRWRETELAVSRDSPLPPLERLATEHGLEVVDTGYAYHIKTPEMSKGNGLERLARELDKKPAAFVAIGDSVNDAPAFERAGTGIAVANGDRSAKAAADHVTDQSFGDGFLEAVHWIQQNKA